MWDWRQQTDSHKVTHGGMEFTTKTVQHCLQKLCIKNQELNLNNESKWLDSVKLSSAFLISITLSFFQMLLEATIDTKRELALAVRSPIQVTNYWRTNKNFLMTFCSLLSIIITTQPLITMWLDCRWWHPVTKFQQILNSNFFVDLIVLLLVQLAQCLSVCLSVTIWCSVGMAKWLQMLLLALS